MSESLAMNWSPTRRKPLPRRSAFSLIELVAVIGIITLGMSLTLQAVSSVVRGRQQERAVYEVSGWMEQAKTFAQAQNTWVWLGFQETVVNGEGGVLVAAVAAKSGRGADLTGENFHVILKPSFLRGVQFVPTTEAGVQDVSASTAGSFEILFQGQRTTFDRIVAYSSNGEASVQAGGVSRVAELRLVDIVNAGNVSVLRLNGLNGKTRVLR
jgi:Tfp pilus assembly protein FimT